MTDRPPPSSPEASLRMKAVRSRGTTPEIELRRELHRRGLRFRVDWSVLPRRRIDIAFPRARVVVQVHGCYWHGCPCRRTSPRANAGFWSEKIEANRARDADTDAQLKGLGWTVVTIWEHEAPKQAADRVVAALGNVPLSSQEPVVPSAQPEQP